MRKTVTGLKKFGDKERRKQRRNNHIARDLMTPKYRQRVKAPKRVADEGRKYRDYDKEDEE